MTLGFFRMDRFYNSLCFKEKRMFVLRVLCIIFIILPKLSQSATHQLNHHKSSQEQDFEGTTKTIDSKEEEDIRISLSSLYFNDAMSCGPSEYSSLGLENKDFDASMKLPKSTTRSLSRCILNDESSTKKGRYADPTPVRHSAGESKELDKSLCQKISVVLSAQFEMCQKEMYQFIDRYTLGKDKGVDACKSFSYIEVNYPSLKEGACGITAIK